MKRDTETRFKECFKNIISGEVEKSSVAAHVWKEKHGMEHKPVLLKQASNKQKINWKNYPYNKKQNHMINFEIPPADYLTKKFILNPVEGSRSAISSYKKFKPKSVVHGFTMRKCSLYIQVSDVLCYKPISITK